MAWGGQIWRYINTVVLVTCAAEGQGRSRGVSQVTETQDLLVVTPWKERFIWGDWACEVSRVLGWHVELSKKYCKCNFWTWERGPNRIVDLGVTRVRHNLVTKQQGQQWLQWVLWEPVRFFRRLAANSQVSRPWLDNKYFKLCRPYDLYC